MDLLCTEQVVLNDCDTFINGNGTTTNTNNYNNTTITATTGTTTTTTTSASTAAATTTTNNNSYITTAGRLNNNSNNGSFNNNHVNRAIVDPTFLADRCLENLLKAEEKYTVTCSYFKTVQKDITPPMRKIVAEWMMDVCEEEKCQEEVVLLALNYMDRFLSTTYVRKTHLQILASACLLLASKLREPSCRGLSTEILVVYTDNSVYKQDLIHWELYVLSRLKWDLSSVTPLDFLELLLIRLPIRNNKCPELSVDKVRQHAQAFISLAAKEHYFSVYSASTIASSSIAAALCGLHWHLRTGVTLRYLLNRLTDLTGVEQDYLHECMLEMEKLFEEHVRNLQPYIVNNNLNVQHHQVTPSAVSQSMSTGNNYNNGNSNINNNCNNTNSMNLSTTIVSTRSPDLTQKCKIQASCTQTDLQDIKF